MQIFDRNYVSSKGLHERQRGFCLPGPVGGTFRDDWQSYHASYISGRFRNSMAVHIQ